MMSRPKVIAFYLPQYHPTPNNDVWWGKGFTEWTNVGKAKSLFRGHEQPKVPADLGYYDLRLPEVRNAQAELAREAGIDGFCYYHYWFGNGHEELDLPFKEVIKSGNPDFPFCLCWANESWHKKFWNMDGTCSKEVLAEQLYESPQDHEAHFYSLLPAFRDERYIKIGGKILFMIYKPIDFKGVGKFIAQWNRLAEENGLDGFFFVGQTTNARDVEVIRELGFDAVNIVRLWDAFSDNFSKRSIKGLLNFAFKKLMGKPFILTYEKAAKYFTGKEDALDYVYPTMIPNWDHTPRSGLGGSVLKESSPEKFFRHAKDILGIVKYKENDRNIVFLKSWNEWGEGNYMEPDLKNGKGYIKALNNALKETD